MPVPPAHAVMTSKTIVNRAIRTNPRGFLAGPLDTASIIPNKPSAGSCNQNAYIGARRDGRSGSTLATEAVVVIDSVEAAGFAPGVTVLGDRLHDVCAGSPLQVSLTA